MRKIFSLFLTFAMCLFAMETMYKERSHKEKMSHPNQLFAITFDSLELASCFAKGSARTSGITDTNLALRGVVGFDSKNAYRAEPDEDLKFPAPGNVKEHQGTARFWVCGLDYAPADDKTNGMERGNICLTELQFGDTKEHINIKVYEWGNELTVLWESTAAPEIKGYNAIALCQTELDFDKGQWYQIAFTWSPEEIALFVNGQERARAHLPEKAALTSKLRMIGENSFIGIRSKFYEDVHKWSTGIDDYQILDRPLTALEIAREYRELCKTATGEAQVYSAKFNGIDTGVGVIDKVEVEFDLSGINDEERKLLRQGLLPMNYTLTGPDGATIANGSFSFTKLQGKHIFSNVDKPGKYTLATDLNDHKSTFTFERPDYSWLNNGIGSEDTVPELWKDFAVDGRKVTLWNRYYEFDDGPLPTRIDTYGTPLLTKPPQLTINGKKIKWKAGQTDQKNSYVTYTGTGKFKGGSIEYKTIVEFDGLINLSFTIKGNPTISKMGINWQVRKSSCEFLMTPLLQKNGAHGYPWPMSHKDSQLWLVGEGTGGFCWTAENDANWVYKDKENVLFADTESGKCEIRMITQKTQMPDDVTYTSLFIATPVRPVTINKHMSYFGFGGNKWPGGITCIGADITQGGFGEVFDIRPGKDWDKWFKNARPKSAMPYSAANSGTENTKEFTYLKKYTEVPGAYSYSMPCWTIVGPGNKSVRENHKSIEVCNTCFVNDWLMMINKAYLDDPRALKITATLYYDLCDNQLCSNPHHGCAFYDKFGRYIKTFVVLSKRDLVKRTVRLAHSRGVRLMTHQQRYFNPVLNGLADSWCPGEQHCALLKKNPMGLIDGSVDEPIFRSEYNWDVLGTGIVQSCPVSQIAPENSSNKKASFASMAMMMLYDINYEALWLNRDAVSQVWDIMLKFGMHEPDVLSHKFYRQKEITSSNPKVLITWYERPGKKLAVLVNRTTEAQDTEIDFSKFMPGDGKLFEEFFKQEVPVSQGKYKVTVPPQAFLLVSDML